MQRVSKGYTIVEVMIFLAVSIALLGAAMNLISGKQSETEFNQKMRDTQSEIQSWINDVATGSSGGDTSAQTCTIQGNKPFVQAVAPTATYTPSCTFLGKAIQFTDQSYSTTQDETIYAYSVFGCRIASCAAQGDYPASLSQANPSPVVGQGGVKLMDTFSLSPAHVKSICPGTAPQPCSPGTTSHLVGLFSSFNTEDSATENGNNDLNVYEFAFNGTAPSADQPGGQPVINCLQLTGTCSSPQPLISYSICLSDGTRSAQVTISSAGGTGVSTRLDYVAC